MTCKFWKPKSEVSGVCTKGNPPIFKLPNWECKNYKFWKL